MTILGVFLALIGLVSLILNSIILRKVKKTCNDDKAVQNSNYGNLVLSVTVLAIGLFMLVYYRQGGKSTHNFGFG